MKTLVALALAMLLIGPVHADDDDDDPPIGEYTPLRVTMEEDVRTLAGIELTGLAAEAGVPTVTATAEVLSLQPLLTQQAQLLQARADVRAASARSEVSNENYQRLRRLQSGNANVAARELAAARAEQRTDAARLDAARATLAGREAGFRDQWGDTLFEWATADERPAAWQTLQARRQLLLLVSLPRRAGQPETGAAIDLVVEGDRLSGTLIGPAPGLSAIGNGPTWYARADAELLRTGMRLTASVPVNGDEQRRIRIPAAAVVWDAGQPWAFVHAGGDDFERRPVSGRAGPGGDWLVEKHFSAGDAVVISGAQLMLAQERRASIPEEDDD